MYAKVPSARTAPAPAQPPEYKNIENKSTPWGAFVICAPGRIRTCADRSRLVYSQVRLTTPPPTRFFASLERRIAHSMPHFWPCYNFSMFRKKAVYFIAALTAWAYPAVSLAQSALTNRIVPCDGANRSEEHTSELQSQSNLVCRLLLEK